MESRLRRRRGSASWCAELRGGHPHGAVCKARACVAFGCASRRMSASCARLTYAHAQARRRPPTPQNPRHRWTLRCGNMQAKDVCIRDRGGDADAAGTSMPCTMAGTTALFARALAAPEPSMPAWGSGPQGGSGRRGHEGHKCKTMMCAVRQAAEMILQHWRGAAQHAPSGARAGDMQRHTRGEEGVGASRQQRKAGSA